MEEIRAISSGQELLKISAKEYMDYFNPFVEEKSYLLRDEPVTLEQEEKWLEKNAKEIDEGKLIKVLLLMDGKLAGMADARRGEDKQRHNVTFGLSVSKEYRGKGYGERLLRMAIEEAEKRLKPHRMWIEYVEGNEVAGKLYEKAGFVEVARLKDYVNHYGKWAGKVIMEYRG